MAFSSSRGSFELPPEIVEYNDKSTLPNPSVLPSEPPKVVVLGTGDFGRALASRLLLNGYQVVMGSRYPGRRNLASRNPALAELEVVPLEQAVQQAEIILVAVPGKVMMDLLRPLSKHLQEKVLVDVSNNSKLREGRSNAEELAETFAGVHVVKAFNTLSAYALQSGQGVGDMEVKIASDSPYAREVITGLARDLGLQAIIYGGLRSARQLERIPLKLWDGWGKPVIVSAVTWLAWFVYGTWRYHYKKQHDWSRWPTNTNNKIMGCSSLTLLALCFLPGSVAAVTQLVRGTKHRAFPSWLASWLNMRKQLGLIALFLASIHCILSVALLAPAYFGRWYDKTSVTIPVNQTDSIKIPVDFRMNWIGETAICLGTLGLAVMAVLGITSLPSVGGRLNWRQWTFVQSYLGHFCLLLSLAHVEVMVMPSIGRRPFFNTIQTMSFLSTVIPTFTLLFRLLLLLPCLSIPLWRIRSGWERGCKGQDDVEMNKAAPGANLHIYANHAFKRQEQTPQASQH